MALRNKKDGLSDRSARLTFIAQQVLLQDSSLGSRRVVSKSPALDVPLWLHAYMEAQPASREALGSLKPLIRPPSIRESVQLPRVDLGPA
jgi:hypothetical protein